MAGMAYYLGLRKLGVSQRTGSGLPGLQWDSIHRFKPKFLVAVPSFLLKLIDYARQHNIDYKNSSVKGVICIGESLLNEIKAWFTKRIQDLWEVELFSTYASTEMATAFTERICTKAIIFYRILSILKSLTNPESPLKMVK